VAVTGVSAGLTDALGSCVMRPVATPWRQTCRTTIKTRLAVSCFPWLWIGLSIRWMSWALTAAIDCVPSAGRAYVSSRIKTMLL